jgi:hypothetical protein
MQTMTRKSITSLATAIALAITPLLGVQASASPVGARAQSPVAPKQQPAEPTRRTRRTKAERKGKARKASGPTPRTNNPSPVAKSSLRMVVDVVRLADDELFENITLTPTKTRPRPNCVAFTDGGAFDIQLTEAQVERLLAGKRAMTVCEGKRFMLQNAR